MLRKAACVLAMLCCLCAVTAFAQDQNPRKASISFGAGSIGGSGVDPNGNHTVFGGEVFLYPFSEKSLGLKRFSLGGGLGKAVLSSETYEDEYFGEVRFQHRAWPLHFGARYDIWSRKHILVAAEAGAALVRKTEAFQVKYYNQWVGIEQFGYSCSGICQTTWHSSLYTGISAGFIFPISHNYVGDIGTEMVFPEVRVKSGSGYKETSVGMRIIFR